MHYMLGTKYPIENVEQVKLASKFVESHLTRFDPVERVAMANHLEKRASELGVHIDSPWVKNYARFMKESAYSPEFESAMALRKTACLDLDISVGESTVKAADLCDCMTSASANIAPQDLASMLYDFDKMAGLDLDYDTKLPDPIFTVVGCHSDPEFDQVKIAGSVTEPKFRAMLKQPEAHEKVASVIGEENTEKLAAAPAEFFVRNPLVRTSVLKAVGFNV